MIVTGCGYPPGGYTISNQSWTQPPGSAIGGYNASGGKGTSIGAIVPLPALNGSSLTFYWVDPGNPRQMTYEYTMSNGQSASTAVTFNVLGPTNPGIVANIGSVEALPLDNNNVVDLNGGGMPAQELTGLTQFGQAGAFGVGFIGSATLPPALPPATPGSSPGSYSWVQLLSRYQYRILWGSAAAFPASKTGRSLCGTAYAQPVLDTQYPYASFLQQASVPHDTVFDGPVIPLTSPGTNVQDAEANVVFSATMFLMWTPAVANSIPVPLASVNWSFGGDAVNTMTSHSATWVGGAQPVQLNTNFLSAPCSSTSEAVQQPCAVIVPGTSPANFGYPVWNANFIDTPSFNCTDF